MFALAFALALAPLEVLDLQVDGPACADESGVREATARYLGRTDIDELDERIKASVQIDEAKAGYSLHIVVDLPDPHPTSDRVIEAADCAEAVDIAGLIISVALDPVAVSREVQPQLDASPVTPPDAAEPTNSEPQSPVADNPKVRAFGLRALGQVGFGQFERASGGVTLGLDYTRKLWRVGAFGRYLFPQAIEVDTDAGIRLSSVVAGVRACVVPRHKKWSFPSCAVVEGGMLVAAGFGLERNDRTRLPLFSLGVGQSIAWRVHPRVDLILALGTGVALIRPRVELDDLGVVFARPSVDFRTALGPSFRF